MRRWTALFLLALASCTSTAVPRPRFPQLEHATEAIEGGGDRYRAHRACSPDARTVDQLITCMRAAGWDFIPRGPGYPEADCWQARDRGEVNAVASQCFARIAERSGGGPP